MNRRLFFGSLVGLGAATSVQIRRAIEAHFTGPERIKVVILDEGMRAKLLRPEAAKGLEG